MDVIKKKKRKGFTLIELIVVIAIIGILAAIMIPKFSGFQDKARKTQVVTDAKQITTAVDSLLTESTTGALTAVTGAKTTADPVVKLSGVDPTLNSFTLDYTTTGGFTLQETINSITYTATRTGTGVAATITQK
ncbi:prepilin-type N-terminal cleavage/methylation domain-containing protein [Clostridium estertheticum]|nr:prepilin-type N-terminal cleavage/methylation domain-containing protein [Clostridium estertheticum]